MNSDRKGFRFPIDKLTNSVERIATKESIATDVTLVSKKEIKRVHKKDGWLFNWKKEFREKGRTVYKLVLAGDQIIQGLVSIEPVTSQYYIEIHLIENAPHNFGQKKELAGVAGNLVAFCCKMSFELGFGGFVAFTAKTSLVNHYKSILGAQLISGRNRMAINTLASIKLVNLYYKNFFNETERKKYYP